MKRIDPTIPMVAPEGYKWVISKDRWMMNRATRTEAYSLCLWFADQDVDRDGCGWSKPLAKAIPNFAKGCKFPVEPEGRAVFYRERDIRAASKRALKAAARKRAVREVEARILGNRLALGVSS